MSSTTYSRELRDKNRGRLRLQLMDLVIDYDELLAGTEHAQRDRLASAVYAYQESLRAAVAAIDQYDVIKRALAAK